MIKVMMTVNISEIPCGYVHDDKLNLLRDNRMLFLDTPSLAVCPS